MQSYTEIAAGTTLDASRPLILSNDKTIMSCHSGTAYPTTNLQVGMLCHRTDLAKLYLLTALTPTWVMIMDLAATPWNSLNDGAGTLLDADTVDGVQAAAFALLAGAAFTGAVTSNHSAGFAATGVTNPIFRLVPSGATSGNLYARLQAPNDGSLYLGYLNDAENTFTRGLRVPASGPLEAIGRGAIWDATNFVLASKQDALGFTPVNKAADTMVGLLTSRNTTGAMNVATQGVPGFQVTGGATAGDAAYLTLYRTTGTYGVRLGLDTDNKLKVGGWSLGAAAHEIWHAGNLTPGNYMPLAGGIFSGGVTGTTIGMSGGITGATISAAGAFTITGGEWFRSNVIATGWYNGAGGGGIYMPDTTYVAVYGGKHFKVPSARVYCGDGGGVGLGRILVQAGGSPPAMVQGDICFIT